MQALVGCLTWDKLNQLKHWMKAKVVVTFFADKPISEKKALKERQQMKDCVILPRATRITYFLHKISQIIFHLIREWNNDVN